jgi:hypothetical protein
LQERNRWICCNYHIYTSETKAQSLDKINGSIDLLDDPLLKNGTPLDSEWDNVGSALDDFARSLGLETEFDDDNNFDNGNSFTNSTNGRDEGKVSGSLLD